MLAHTHTCRPGGRPSSRQAGAGRPLRAPSTSVSTMAIATTAAAAFCMGHGAGFRRVAAWCCCGSSDHGGHVASGAGCAVLTH